MPAQEARRYGHGRCEEGVRVLAVCLPLCRNEMPAAGYAWRRLCQAGLGAGKAGGGMPAHCHAEKRQPSRARSYIREEE